MNLITKNCSDLATVIIEELNNKCILEKNLDNIDTKLDIFCLEIALKHGLIFERNSNNDLVFTRE